MTTRYYEETPDPCGLDRMGEHWIDELLGKDGLCPGGSRRELEGVEIQEAEITPAGCVVDYWSLNVDQLGGPGRYAIIPLPEETE